MAHARLDQQIDGPADLGRACIAPRLPRRAGPPSQRGNDGSPGSTPSGSAVRAVFITIASNW